MCVMGRMGRVMFHNAFASLDEVLLSARSFFSSGVNSCLLLHGDVTALLTAVSKRQLSDSVCIFVSWLACKPIVLGRVKVVKVLDIATCE